MEITLNIFKALVPHNRNPEQWFAPLNQALKDFEINTTLRIAHFMAQCSHESGDFNYTVENLNYDSNGLLKIFPYYFKSVSGATLYAHNPEKIANYVYANRLGNGDVNSGDGWKYRGRGILQITGRRRYDQIGKQLSMDFITHPELVETPEFACKTAGLYWKNNNINHYADLNNILGCTLAVNGGYNGLDDRKNRFNAIIALL
jgi:putative chitinase